MRGASLRAAEVAATGLSAGAILAKERVARRTEGSFPHHAARRPHAWAEEEAGGAGQSLAPGGGSRTKPSTLSLYSMSFNMVMINIMMRINMMMSWLCRSRHDDDPDHGHDDDNRNDDKHEDNSQP